MHAGAELDAAQFKPNEEAAMYTFGGATIPETAAERLRLLAAGVLEILLAALTAIGWVAILLRVFG